MIAVAGPNLPVELLAASGRYAGLLAFDPDRQTPRADQWLESKFAPWARPVLEAWVEGEYDHLDQVLFSRTDDTSQRLYYYLCELQRRGHIGGPEPLILDIALIQRRSSLERTVAKLRELAATLDVDAASLEAALAQRAANARTIQAPEAAMSDAPGCLLAGTPAPDRRLHRVIEQAGFAPAGCTLTENWAAGVPVTGREDADPFVALGRCIHAGARGPRSFVDPAASLAARIERCAARAVILWRIEQDEAQCWHLPAERGAIEASGLPALVLTRRDWLARDGAAEEIQTFLQEVKA